MLIGRVVGTLVATRKNAKLEGAKLLLVQPLDLAGQAQGGAVLAIDSVSAGVGDRVLLVQEYSARPVEMGAVRIDLLAFKPRIRSQILSNRVPLGRLLRDGGVDYKSRPTVFLAVTPNSEMMGVFWMREPRILYGRQTEMSIDGRKVGDIVEILPLV